MTPMHCGLPARLVSGALVYGPTYRDTRLWVCARWPTCDAYVGVHKGTERPLGTLADRPTREARRRAHAALDPLWRTEGRRKRREVYRALAEHLGLPVAHIGEMDPAQCQRTVEWSTSQRTR